MVSLSRVWLITVFISPVVFWTLTAIRESEDLSDVFSFIPILIIPSIPLGFVFSIPTMAVFYWVNKQFYDKDFHPITTKILLSLILITGILATSRFIGGILFTPQDFLSLPAVYLYCSLAALWFFSEDPETKKEQENQSYS